MLNSIVGWDSTIGRWARVEGTPSDPNPNDPYAKINSETLFRDGRLTPSITILGKFYTVSPFPNKQLGPSCLFKQESLVGLQLLPSLLSELILFKPLPPPHPANRMQCDHSR